MKIVHLEEHASNFDSLVTPDFWSELGEYVPYERTAPEELVPRCKDAELLIVNKSKITAEVVALLPKLRYVGELATGYNNIDLEACKARGIAVTNVPAYSTEDVVQLTFAHLFNLLNAVETHAQADWSKSPDFCQVLTPQRELAGMTMGIVGYGAIGRRTAEAAHAFGVKVLCFTRTPSKIKEAFVKAVSFEELLKESDIVTLHCPMNKESALMMDHQAFSMMKQGAFFINTARGGLVDEAALAEALNSGHLAGAGLDVLTQEPPAPDNVLLHAKNCRLSPHIAWTTKEARMRLFATARENLRSYLSGGTLNRIV